MSSGSSNQNSAAELNALKERIIQQINVKDFYQQRVTDVLRIKSDGWSQLVKCPIHNDTSKPNLSINIHSGGFKCFAQCGGGSIFDFWARTNGYGQGQGFREALIALANIAGVDIGKFHTEGIYTTKPVDATATPAPKGYVPNVNKVKVHDESNPPLPKHLIENYVKQLQSEHFKYLNIERGLTVKTIAERQIGWDAKKKYRNKENLLARGKFVIPIPDKDGLLRNFRVYAQDAPSDFKMLNTKGHGSPPRLYPLHLLKLHKWENVVICEGEFDCILLNQKFDEAGISSLYGAVTNTAGCSTFEAEWVEDLYGCNVFFVLDMDEAGKAWAHTHATKKFLEPLSSGKILSLKVVHLPLSGQKNEKDIGDYFLKLGHTIEEFMQCLDATPEIEVGGTDCNDATVEAIEISDFVECVKDRRYIDQRVRVPLTISGQSSKVYHATREFRVCSCPLMKDDSCCAGHGQPQLVSYGDELLIESCMISKRQLQVALQNMACSKNQKCSVEELEKVVMEEFYGHQIIKRLIGTENEDGWIVNSQELITAPIYVLQPEKNIRVGMQDYIATGYVRSHPQTRHVCLLVEHLEPLEEDWRTYKVDAKAIRNLKVIQSFASEKRKIGDDNKEHSGISLILKELIYGVTKIYKSDDILLTVLLTYLSPLRFVFNGEFIRGWLNSCIIGDSATGKSATYMRISDWLELGDLFSALSGSRTGLLYALDKHRGVDWYVKIGRYVMASGKIIAIDEAQQILPEELEKMALAMDDGWLAVNQVASGGYRTQTRTLFLMNPKHGKKISDFAFGCKSLTECFYQMFIRRLDIAIFSTGKEDYDFYNRENISAESKVEMKLNPEILRSLVFWSWTRTADDITWTEEATRQCLESTIKLANIFGHADDIPLVSPQNFRKNLARLSTAYAILCGSFTQDYEGVTVKEKHVLDMEKFINVEYSESACNLKQYSKLSGQKKIMRDYEKVEETVNEVVKKYDESPDAKWREGQHFLQLLLILQQQQFVTKRSLVDQLAVSPTWAHRHLNILQGHNLVEPSRAGVYKATRRFNLFMRRWQESGEIEKKLESVYTKIGKMAMNGELSDVRYGDGVSYNGYQRGQAGEYATAYDPFHGEDNPFDREESPGSIGEATDHGT